MPRLCSHILMQLVGVRTFLSGSRSALFPNNTNGNDSGSFGDPCNKNSSLQLSKDSNDYGEYDFRSCTHRHGEMKGVTLALVMSYTKTQQSAPL